MTDFWLKSDDFWSNIEVKEVKMHSKVNLLELKLIPKQFPNNSQTCLRNAQKGCFWPWKWPKCTSQNDRFLTKKWRFLVQYWSKGGENALKSGPFRAKTNAQTIPKQLPNMFEKCPKRVFFTQKWPKFTSQNDRILTKKWRFLTVFWTYRLYFWH